MKKLPTLFPKNPDNLRLVVNDKPVIELTPDLRFYIKLDGRACAVFNTVFYTRYDAKLIKRKRGKVIKLSKEEVMKKIPKGAIECQEPDEKSGHWPHWIPADLDNKDHKPIYEGILNVLKEGIYSHLDNCTCECIGPKVNNNPHGLDKHYVIKHNSDFLDVSRSIYYNELMKNPYEYLKDFLTNFPYEGLVIWKDNEPVAKIRRSDFGLDVSHPIEKYSTDFLNKAKL